MWDIIYLTLNILMSSKFGCTGGGVDCSSRNIILDKRTIFCTLRRCPSTVSGRTVCKAIRSFNWMPDDKFKTHVTIMHRLGLLVITILGSQSTICVFIWTNHRTDSSVLCTLLYKLNVLTNSKISQPTNAVRGIVLIIILVSQTLNFPACSKYYSQLL